MERLDISITPGRPNIEAAIHFARYAICKKLAKGKRVLDVACGEGYGSYILKEAGAEYVVGVDISKESIAKAERLFSKEGLRYQAADVVDLDTLFAEGEFDIVISVETIEHLADPTAFLKSIKRIAKPGGIIILSCPNDHWYYPQDDQANPYHLRKYRLNEFQQISTNILGNNVKWSIGTGVFGFGSTPVEVNESHAGVPGSWMSYMDVENAYLVNGEQKPLLSETECSYFIGVWNAPDWTVGVAVFPLKMDDYASMADANDIKKSAINLQQALDSKNTEITNLQQVLHTANTEIEKEIRRIGLKLQASQAECEIMREANVSLRAECDTMRLGYHRYLKIRRLTPPRLRSIGVKIFRFFRR